PTSTPIVIPTVEAVITHPELEIITSRNVARLEKIDQWGQGSVNGVALSPDGNLIAVSTTTGIYLYDRKTVKQIGYIDIRVGENDDVETQACPASGNLAFSPDGSILAIASTDIRLWDLKTNTVQTVIKNKIEDTDSIITEIQFSQDGKSVFGVQKNASKYPCYLGWGSLVIYTTDNGELVLRHDFNRNEEALSPIFTERNGIAYIAYYEAQNGYFLLKVNSQTGEILIEKQSSAIFSMNSKAAVTNKWIPIGDSGDGYSEAHVIDLTSFEDIEVLKANVKLIPQSDRMIIREKQKLTIRTLEGKVICSKSISSESDNVFTPDMFSLDGSIAISWNYYGDRAGDVHIWDLEQCTISKPVLIFPEVAREISFSSNGRSLLTGSRAGYTFHVFDVQTGKLRFSLSGFDAKFSASENQVLVVEEKAINAYDVETGEYLSPVVKGNFDYMTDVLVSPDGKFLGIIDTSTNGFQIVNIGNNSEIDTLMAFDNSNLYFSRNGNFAATVSGNLGVSEFRFWELATGNELIEWQGMVPTEGYINISFSSDFTQLATFGTDGYYKYVYIWNMPEFSLAKTLTQAFPNSDRSINNLEFISNNQLLFAFGSNPDAFIFWNISTGNLLSELPVQVHRSELGNHIVFSPDERLLTVLDGDGTIHIWGVK
ncbi:MAG TPA: hypothetical protein DIW23_11235, partial [Anaerolineae bacterium]|nr:hypothetical protein [Anaerolineae bacterium]